MAPGLVEEASSRVDLRGHLALQVIVIVGYIYNVGQVIGQELHSLLLPVHMQRSLDGGAGKHIGEGYTIREGLAFSTEAEEEIVGQFSCWKNGNR